MKMWRKAYRWRKRIVLGLAALPMLQATGCDPFAANDLIGQQFVGSIFQLFVFSIQQVLVNNFPSSDVVQTFIGVNQQPFFTL